jgi:hypothetical protein
VGFLCSDQPVLPPICVSECQGVSPPWLPVWLSGAFPDAGLREGQGPSSDGGVVQQAGFVLASCFGGVDTLLGCWSTVPVGKALMGLRGRL